METGDHQRPDGGRPRRRVGLVRSVVLTLATLVLATLALNALFVWTASWGERSRRQRQLALTTATALAEQVEGTLIRQDQILAPDTALLLQPLVEDLAGGALQPSSVLIVDATRRRIVGVGGAAEGELLPPDLGEALRTGRSSTGIDLDAASFWGPREVYATVPIEVGPQRVGAVRVALRSGGRESWLLDTRLLMFLLYTAVAVAIVTVVGLIIFRNRILLPVRVLMAGTSQVAEGLFSVRVPEEDPSELGELAASFNRMAGELERYQARTEEQLAELQHINDLLERARDELVFQARMASVGRLAAGVAHEIGNPLSAMVGMVDLLREADLDEEERADMLRRIAGELQRVNLTVRDLLDHARPGEVERVPVRVDEVVAAACEMVAMQRDFDRVEIRRDVPDDLPAVIADAHRLRQVLINLLLNARDAMDGQGVVTIEARRRGDRCVIEVVDDGPGVKEQDAESIFDPFFTTKQPGQGTGLGLSVSLQIVEGLGGRLRLGARDGAGAVFVIELPLADGAS